MAKYSFFSIKNLCSKKITTNTKYFQRDKKNTHIHTQRINLNDACKEMT